MLEDTQIAELAKAMKNNTDLLSVLNQMRMANAEDLQPGVPVHLFTANELTYFASPYHQEGRFHQFAIRKKSGGMRIITAPQSRIYRALLDYVCCMLNAIYTPSAYAMGFCRGRSVADNARLHTNRNYVFNTDLKDFFPSIERERVRKRLQMQPFCFPREVANTISGLCCMLVSDEDGVRQVLPQGAPTSPILTNAICDKLDLRMGGLARRFNLTYTRYADDITFSSNHYVYAREGEFMKEFRTIIASQHFTLNEAKTRLQKRDERQEVTGLTVSHRINVTRKYIANIRNLLYIWRTYGYGEAHRKFYPRYIAEKGHVKKGEPNLANVLNGKLLYLKMVRGAEDPLYLKLKNEYDYLMSTEA